MLTYYKYSLLSYLYVRLNLEPQNDFIQKHFLTNTLSTVPYVQLDRLDRIH